MNSLNVCCNQDEIELQKLKFFENQINGKSEDENTCIGSKGFLTLFIKVIAFFFDRYEKLEIRRKSEVFSEAEAAMYLRLSNPENVGRNSIRYYALEAKLLSYIKIGRDGLLFKRSDLDNFLENQRVISHRDLFQGGLRCKK